MERERPMTKWTSTAFKEREGIGHSSWCVAVVMIGEDGGILFPNLSPAVNKLFTLVIPMAPMF